MSAAEKAAKVSLTAYFELDTASETKYEYEWGDVVAMAGASFEHNVIVANITSALHRQLRNRPCVTMPSDMRLFVHNQMYAYPDVMVVCGTPELVREKGDTLLNPTVIVEVLSPSTEQRDRGAKWQAYREIESLREYVMVHQDEARAEHYERTAEGWLLRDVVGLEGVVVLRGIDCTLSLADAYEKVEFSTPEGTQGDASAPADGLGGL